jgi:epoxyqueuosine reductase
MHPDNLSRDIHERLAKKKWKGKIVSIEHLGDLQREIESHHQKGLLDQDLYDAYLDRFEFNILDDYPDARSLIIVTAPQIQVRVAFRWQGQTYAGIIPPTYDQATDGEIKAALENLLIPYGYYLEKKRLPEKLLAVCSGLARYGKNNITYVPGMGSFQRPVVFVSDVPCADDKWGKPKTLKSCDGCSACLEACPTGAIASNRFLLHAERCITFHNERPPGFPQWLNPAWHNSLIGCMTCQNACPLNKKLVNRIEDGPEFDEKETALLLLAVPKDAMLPKTVGKLEKLGMIEYAAVLGRNLKTLIDIEG